MFRNNVLNDVSVPEEIKVQYEQNIKGRLKNVKTPTIPLNANVEYEICNYDKFESCEERTVLNVTKKCSNYPKGDIHIEILQPTMNRTIDTSISKGKKNKNEHNGGVMNLENEVELSLKKTTCLGRQNNHNKGRHDWSQLSTSKICQILEEIPGKKNKSRVQSSSFQERLYPQKVHDQKTEEKNQDWSHIPNEGICTLIERIASRRSKSLKQTSHSDYQVKEIIEAIGSARNGVRKSEVMETLHFKDERGCENSGRHNVNSESIISNMISFPFLKDRTQLITALEKKRKSLVTVSRTHDGKLRKLDNEPIIKLNRPANRFFNQVMMIFNHSFSHETMIHTYTVLQLNAANNIWDFRKHPIQLIESGVINTTNTFQDVWRSQDLYGDFTVLVSKNSNGPKKSTDGCRYSLKALRLLHYAFGTYQKNTLYHRIAYHTTTMEENYSSNAQYKKKKPQKNAVVRNRIHANSWMTSKKVCVHRLDGVGSSQRFQHSEEKENSREMNSVQVNDTHNRNIISDLRNIFHRLYCDGCSKKTDLSKSLFYDDSTEKWVKIEDLVHH